MRTIVWISRSHMKQLVVVDHVCHPSTYTRGFEDNRILDAQGPDNLAMAAEINKEIKHFSNKVKGKLWYLRSPSDFYTYHGIYTAILTHTHCTYTPITHVEAGLKIKMSPDFFIVEIKINKCLPFNTMWNYIWTKILAIKWNSIKY